MFIQIKKKKTTQKTRNSRTCRACVSKKKSVNDINDSEEWRAISKDIEKKCLQAASVYNNRTANTTKMKNANALE